MATTQAYPPGPPHGTAQAQKLPEYKENLNIHMICKDCKEVPPNLVENFSSGDMVCGSCGLVLGERIIDTRSEWRTFSNDDQAGDDPSRVGDGGNPLLNGSQLETTISFGDGSARSRELARAQSKSTNDKANKNLMSAYKEIGAYCDAISITKQVSDLAKLLFKEVANAGIFKGKSQEAIIAGVIVIACRQQKAPRTFKEITSLTKVPKADIGRVFKQLKKFFTNKNIEKMEAIINAGGSAPADGGYGATTANGPGELCLRFCSQLQLQPPIPMISEELAEKASELGQLAGRSPLSIAAACIFMASHLMGDPKTAKDISAVAGVSDGTIRTAYKHLFPEREKMINKRHLVDGKGDLKRLPQV